MPCDIGYQSVARARIAAKKPDTFASRASAPEVDRELLDCLGQDDPEFLAWWRELDADPLLQKALARTLVALGPLGDDVALSVQDGALSSRITAAKAEAEALAAKIAGRWQMEVLRIVCELLDYDVSLTGRNGKLVIESDKHGDGGVHESIAVTHDANDAAEVRFEHFSSDEALATEQGRLLTLAHKLGVRLRLSGERRAGQPIPKGTVHPHGHKGRGKS
jgi:hypothetical protein